MKTKNVTESILTKREKIACAFNSAGVQTAVQTLDSFMLYFYTDVLRITAGLAGMVSTIAIAWDGINDPIVGNIIDNHKGKNGERFRSLLKFFSFPFAVFFILMFAVPNVSIELKFAYALVLRIMYDTFSTVINVSMNGLVMVLSPLKKDRISLGQCNTFGGMLGIGIASVAFLPLVRLFGGSDGSGKVANEQLGFIITASCIGVLAVICMLFYYFSSKERVLPDCGKSEKIPIFKALARLLPNKQWRLVTLFRLFFTICNGISIATLTYYCKYVLGNPLYMSTLMVFFLASSLISAQIAAPISKRLSIRGLSMIMAFCLIAGKIVFIISPSSIVNMSINVVLTGVALSFGNISFYVYNAFLGDLVAKEFGQRRDGIVVSLSGFFAKIGNALTLLFIGIALQLTHYNGALTVQPGSAINAINAFNGWAPLAVAFILLWLSAVIKVEKMADEVAAL